MDFSAARTHDEDVTSEKRGLRRVSQAEDGEAAVARDEADGEVVPGGQGSGRSRRIR